MALRLICSGLRPRLPEREPVPAPRGFLTARRRRAGIAARIAACALLCVAANASSQAPDLLENERAFAFAARAIDPGAIEVRFVVAPGYYLYRDKLRFAVDPGMLGAVPDLPRGQMKHDEFFGDSETYRGTVLVRLAVDQVRAGQPVTVSAESQGCADLGVCYPPQRQQVVVTVPRPRARAGAFVEAAPKRGWFR